MEPMLSYAIIGHLVGDYLLQNDWMAEGKKRNSWICALHAAIWTLSVMVIGEFEPRLLTGLVLWGTHFVQDRGSLVQKWMWLIGQDKFLQPPMSPWSIIVVDNVWHLVVIWAVAKWWA